MNSNKKLYILVAVLVILLAVTIALICTLRPQSPANVQVQETLMPSPSPVLIVELTPQPEPTADSSDPLAGLTEEEIGQLAMAEENHAEDDAAPAD